MQGYLGSYATLALVLAAGVLVFVGAFAANKLLRPAHPAEPAGKRLSYESGVDPVGVGWSQSQVRYYIFALLFVLFDVEAVFIFPWATRLEVYGWFGAIEMIVFIVLLSLGLLYAWRKGVLRWI